MMAALLRSWLQSVTILSNSPAKGGKGSLSCKFCAFLCNRIVSSAGCASLWDKGEAWDRDESNEWELWLADPAEVRELNVQASQLRSTDPEAAFQLYVRAADAGSPWAMEVVASHYQHGTVVEPNFDRMCEFYCRAIQSGSWMATIKYARTLDMYGYHDECDDVLRGGVDARFAPSFYWLARLRLTRSKSRKTCREVRPLLEYAAEVGHPLAAPLLGVMMMLGKFGFGQIQAGIRLLLSGEPRTGGAADEPVRIASDA